MVDGDGDDVVGWYDINYIYRRMTPRFVDYDEVEAVILVILIAWVVARFSNLTRF